MKCPKCGCKMHETTSGINPYGEIYRKYWCPDCKSNHSTEEGGRDSDSEHFVQPNERKWFP